MFTLRCSQTNSHGKRPLGRRWMSQAVAEAIQAGTSRTTTRQTLTQGRRFFKNNCNIDVTRQIVRYIRALMRWRRTSLGVTLSLPNTSLTGNLAINSTRPSRCAAWGPLESTTVINRKEAGGATEKDAARRRSYGRDPVLLCQVLSGRNTRNVSRGETIVSGWISS